MISYQISDNQNAKISAGGVVFREVDGEYQFALLKRNPHTKRNPVDKPSFHLPKGTLEPGETLEEAAIREIKEEAGLITKLRKYLRASALKLRREKEPSFRDRDDNQIAIIYFLAEYIKDAANGMDHEHDEVLWLNKSDAIDKLKGYWKHEDELIKAAALHLEHESTE